MRLSQRAQRFIVLRNMRTIQRILDLNMFCIQQAAAHHDAAWVHRIMYLRIEGCKIWGVSAFTEQHVHMMSAELDIDIVIVFDFS